jgi:hypothetical protein
MELDRVHSMREDSTRLAPGGEYSFIIAGGERLFVSSDALDPGDKLFEGGLAHVHPRQRRLVPRKSKASSKLPGSMATTGDSAGWQALPDRARLTVRDEMSGRIAGILKPRVADRPHTLTPPRFKRLHMS